jgi:hypothetical protein
MDEFGERRNGNEGDGGASDSDHYILVTGCVISCIGMNGRKHPLLLDRLPELISSSLSHEAPSPIFLDQQGN